MINIIEINRSDFETSCPKDVPYCYSPVWLDVYANVFCYRPKYYHIMNDRSVIGVFSFVCIKSMLFGNRIVSMPLSDEGGVVLFDPSSISLEFKQEIVGQVSRLLKQEARLQNVAIIEIRGYNPLVHEYDADKLFLKKKVYVRFVLDTGRDYNSLQANYQTNIHKNLKKAQQHIAVDECVSVAAIPEIYNIYLLQMRQFGSPPLSIDYFSCLLESLVAKIFLAKKTGSGIVGFLLVFIYNNRMYADINASLLSYNSCFPKVFLFDESIKWACMNGIRTYDFMRTRTGSGVYEHKKKWGGTEKPIYYYYLTTKQQRELLLDPEQSRFVLPKRILQHMPLGGLKRIGPWIRREAGK
ncbi:MAG: GNAT family N-acetyltransferase [Candidatus Omnitrophica bacterium]|nr:GNAT family N-acetyltransferase [Candidatus Omnitrophota bacterium]